MVKAVTGHRKGGKHHNLTRSSHYDDTHKYEKQQHRTFENKLKAQKLHLVNHPHDLQNRKVLIASGLEKFAPSIPSEVQMALGIRTGQLRQRRLEVKLHPVCKCRKDEAGNLLHHCGSTNWGRSEKEARLAYIDIVMCSKCQKSPKLMCYMHREQLIKGG
jgi:hypothetical protein